MRFTSTIFRAAVLFIVPFCTNSTYAILVDFEDLTPTNSYSGPGGGFYWNGPDPDGIDFPDPFGGPLPLKVGSFESGGIKFVNRYNLNYDNWSGFAYSNTTDTTTPGFANQYSAFPGSGNGPGADNYGVAFGYSDSLDPTDPLELNGLPWLEVPDGTSVVHAHVTNTTTAALSMLHGDAFAKKFGGPTGDDPDFFVMTVYGTDPMGMPLSESVEFYLADFRFGNNTLDYVIDSWTQIDLSTLSQAKRLHFNLTSSDVGAFGMNTPGFFAIDDVVLVPEPFSGTTLAVGLAMLTIRRRPRGAWKTC